MSLWLFQIEKYNALLFTISWNERDKNNVHKIIFVFDDFGLQSLSILILWFDLRKVCICGCVIDPKGRWAWSKDERSSRAVDLILKVDLSGSSKGLLGLIFEEQWRTDLQGLLGLILKNSDERIFKGFWAWSWRTVGCVDLSTLLIQRAVGAWSWMNGWWTMVLSSRAVGAWSWKSDERRTKNTFLILREPGCLRASEFQSFRASRCNINWFPPQMNEIGLVFIEFSKA